MPISDSPIAWRQVPAGTLSEGDRTKWGYGAQMQNSFRTVVRVEKRYGGIVRVYHRETDPRFYEEYAETFMVTAASD